MRGRPGCRSAGKWVSMRFLSDCFLLRLVHVEVSSWCMLLGDPLRVHRVFWLCGSHNVVCQPAPFHCQLEGCRDENLANLENPNSGHESWRLTVWAVLVVIL